MNEFNLTITLGNDAMRTARDVSLALHELRGTLENSSAWEDADHSEHIIWDTNGNRVGKWTVTPPEPVEQRFSATVNGVERSVWIKVPAGTELDANEAETLIMNTQDLYWAFYENATDDDYDADLIDPKFGE